MRNQFHKSAGQYHEEDKQRADERMGAVVKFLRANPLSTAEEVFKATGYGVIGIKYIRHTKYHGRTVWRLNHARLRQDGLE